MTLVSSALDQTSRRLFKLSDSPDLDAQNLLAQVMQQPRSWLLAHSEASLEPATLSSLEASVQRLEHGEPLPYVLGEWEFFNLPFEVTPAVLIPRPETELLVERAIAWARNRIQETGRCAVLDVGTGCGCIAITLAVNVPGARVFATELSSAALVVANRNAGRLVPDGRITFLEADLLPGIEYNTSDTTSSGAFPAVFDLIVANLPYIPTHALHHLPIYTREPTLALDGGADGLVLIRRLLAVAPPRLSPGGLMLLEIEAFEGPAVLSLAYDIFDQADIHLHRDLSGRDRLLEIELIPVEESS